MKRREEIKVPVYFNTDVTENSAKISQELGMDVTLTPDDFDIKDVYIMTDRISFYGERDFYGETVVGVEMDVSTIYVRMSIEQFRSALWEE